MANIAQILIKIRKELTTQKSDKGDYLEITQSHFSLIMRAPGYPCYAAQKSITEKWRALKAYYGLVIKTEFDNRGNPVSYRLSVEKVEDLIDQFMPDEARNNLAIKNQYLKTGRC